MSKTIDVEQEVRAGDTWTIRESGGPVYQYREGKCMCVWSFVRRHNHCGPGRLSDEIDVSKDFAFGVLRSWGYTLTQPEPKGEKAETDLAATVKRVEERITQVSEAVDELEEVVFTMDRRVAKLEAATTPAKVRVVAPEADGMHTPVWRNGWRQADRAWRAAITTGNIEIVEASK